MLSPSVFWRTLIVLYFRTKLLLIARPDRVPKAPRTLAH
jgi:hypothetical protein